MKEFIVIFGVLCFCLLFFYLKTKNSNEHDDEHIDPVPIVQTKAGFSSVGLVDSEDYQKGILGQQEKEEIKKQDYKKPMVWIETTSYSQDIKSFIPSIKNDSSILKKHKLTLLVIDDSITILNYINNLLIDSNYNIVFKTNANEALEFIKDSLVLPDLIICDIEMPTVSGIDFIKNIKTEKKFTSIPVIFISSNVSNHLNILESENVNGLIQKPFSSEEFKNQIEYVLNTK